MKRKQFVTIFTRLGLSSCGFALALLFFAASLTPSLIPRAAHVQGILGGTVMAMGYCIAILLLACWRFLEIPEFTGRYRRGGSAVLILLAVGTFAPFLFNLRTSQNELRGIMNMAPLSSYHELTVIVITGVVFIILLFLGRLGLILFRLVNNRIPNKVPPRVSGLVSFILVALISWNIGNGVIARRALNFADEALSEIDSRIDPDLSAPADSLRTGSNASLISWESLGARGREFISGGFTAREISAIHNNMSAKAPIRVYAGINSAEEMQIRAELILKEMKRVGAFDRAYLVITTPTGTGWIDPASVDPFEVLHRGDTAIVGMQYSYLMSPLALLIEPDLAPKSARALVDTVYGYWRQLPEDSRPKLYLHGLSLGSYGSEHALSPLNMIDDPINGALWSGPTFGNPLWKNFTNNRNPGSPTWLPRVGDGKTTRFTTQNNTLDLPNTQWSKMRLIFLQYPSDPITFFEMGSGLYRPAWMGEERAPDVSENLRWYPLITMLQQAVDMLIATDVPAGFGHVFAAEHYLHAWIALTDPKGWRPEYEKKLLDELRSQ